MTDYAVKALPAANDLVLIVDVHDASESAQGTTKLVTAGSLGGAGSGAGVSNIDGGSAVTGQFPTGSSDGGSATTGQFPAGDIDGGSA